MTHKLTTQHTTAALEARDTEESPLPFAIDPIEQDGRYQDNDEVILTSKDGDMFIAHISRADEDNLRIYIELD